MAQPESPVRVAFILHAMQVAGAEMLVAEIIWRLGHRLDPVVICLDDVGQLGERMIAEGVPVVALRRRPGLDLRVAWRLANELRARRIEVVHAHQYTPFFYTALARLAARRRLHVLFTEHGRHYPDIVSTRRRLANRFVLSRLADQTTAVCDFSARSLSAVDGFPAQRVTVIRNGIDIPDAFEDAARRDLRARLGLSNDRQYVACVARFHPVKDHVMLLRAFALVSAQQPDVDLLLIGDGPLRGDLEAQADALGIRPHVHFLGIRDDVPCLLAAADIFALTSVSEAASLTLLQAMAAGRPVVVTDVGGNGEIVRNGVEGILVPRGDAKAAAAALLDVLRDPDTARGMGRAGRARVVERYRLDDIVRQYFDVYAAAADRLRRKG